MSPYTNNSVSITFAGETLLLDASGAIYTPTYETLLISDLHLEKASFLGRFGSVLPHYDTRDTLDRVKHLLQHYKPKRVICLGDSFHDMEGVERLSREDVLVLEELLDSCKEWKWILGNHDASLSGVKGSFEPHGRLGNILLTHEPMKDSMPQIIGHYHPKVTIKLAGNRVSGRCFLIGSDMLVMPAFGSFTGGLDSQHEVISHLSEKPFQRYLIYKERLWCV